MVILQEDTDAVDNPSEEISIHNLEDVLESNEPNPNKVFEARFLFISSRLFGRMNISMDAAELLLLSF